MLINPNSLINSSVGIIHILLPGAGELNVTFNYFLKNNLLYGPLAHIHILLLLLLSSLEMPILDLGLICFKFGFHQPFSFSNFQQNSNSLSEEYILDLVASHVLVGIMFAFVLYQMISYRMHCP